ncbi:hypothetical protein BJX64DRAFT_263713, partial [Aspergillus heterothallicus]
MYEAAVKGWHEGVVAMMLDRVHLYNIATAARAELAVQLSKAISKAASQGFWKTVRVLERFLYVRKLRTYSHSARR